VQLLGPALPTSRQLAAFRGAEGFGTALPSSTMWMSATVDHEALSTVDSPEVGSTLTLADADRDGPLAARLGAAKRVERVETDPRRYERSLAQVATEVHRPGTRTLVICNTVARAQAVHRVLDRALPAGVERVLLHSRFRPRDRRDRTRDALEAVDPSGPGQVLVATQVLEAGVDLTSATLLTEAGPWASMVQRAGRCNRDGSQPDARFLWTVPPNTRPYDADDVAGAIRALDELEGRIVTPGLLRQVKVSSARPLHPVLRRRDLRSLFDTAPDLAGNDVDVAPYIRDSDDLDVQVAWWDVPANGSPPPDRAAPAREELCPVPVGTFRKVVKDQAVAWRFDALGGQWVRVGARDVRPGLVAVLRAADGRYDPGRGWDPRARSAVPVVEVALPPGPAIDADPSFSGDPASEGTRWVTLAEHLDDVGRAVAGMLDALGEMDLPGGAAAAAELAGRLHDIGKAHPVFQDALAALLADTQTGGVPEPQGPGPWAKSGINRPIRYSRRRFRHELVSALALFGEAGSVLDSVEEADLVRYLVAAHHGRVRLSMRGLPDDAPCPCGHGDPVPSVLGVCGDDVLAGVTIEGPGGDPLEVPRTTIAMWPALLGRQDGEQPSWMERTVVLRDRADLGPFRLAFLEAVVRTADWRASREEELAPVAGQGSGALEGEAP
jgi:CRISPR-associated endonuclease/helicase Cas3